MTTIPRLSPPGTMLPPTAARFSAAKSAPANSGPASEVKLPRRTVLKSFTLGGVLAGLAQLVGIKSARAERPLDLKPAEIASFHPNYPDKATIIVRRDYPVINPQVGLKSKATINFEIQLDYPQVVILDMELRNREMLASKPYSGPQINQKTEDNPLGGVEKGGPMPPKMVRPVLAFFEAQIAPKVQQEVDELAKKSKSPADFAVQWFTQTGELPYLHNGTVTYHGTTDKMKWQDSLNGHFIHAEIGGKRFIVSGNHHPYPKAHEGAVLTAIA